MNIVQQFEVVLERVSFLDVVWQCIIECENAVVELGKHIPDLKECFGDLLLIRNKLFRKPNQFLVERVLRIQVIVNILVEILQILADFDFN